MNLRNRLAGAVALTLVIAACSNNDYDGDRPMAPRANAAPIVAAIADVTANQDTVVGPLEFTVNDDTTPANMLMVTAMANGDSPFPADSIIIGGEIVHPGDLIVGDADGLVVVRREEAAEVAALSQAREDAEAGYIADYKAGKSVIEVSKLEAVLKAKGLTVEA